MSSEGLASSLAPLALDQAEQIMPGVPELSSIGSVWEKRLCQRLLEADSGGVYFFTTKPA